jgi:hypothetical protein
MYIFMLFYININMSTYSKRFNKILEQDDELSDAQALDSELEDITADELGADAPADITSSINNQQKTNV